MAIPFAFPPALNKSSCCSTFLPTLNVVSVLDLGHSYRWYYIVVSICISLITWCRVSYHMLICHLFIFFMRYLLNIIVSDPFLIRLLSLWILVVLGVFWILIHLKNLTKDLSFLHLVLTVLENFTKYWNLSHFYLYLFFSILISIILYTKYILWVNFCTWISV